MIVCIAVPVMRHKYPDAERPFRCPWVPVVPVLGCALALLQMAFLPAGTWTRLLVWMALGLIVYGCYGHTHSRLHGKNNKSPR